MGNVRGRTIDYFGRNEKGGKVSKLSTTNFSTCLIIEISTSFLYEIKKAGAD